MRFLAVLLILLAGLLLYIWLKKKTILAIEAFQQAEPFSLKMEDDIYDDFYCDIYDRLMLPDERVEYEMKLLQPFLESSQKEKTSKILDIGSGTGSLVHRLKKEGYDVVGADKSKAMVERGRGVLLGNVEDPMLFEKNEFSMALCLDFTIYEMKDKSRFFKNVYGWLGRGGLFILHLVEKDSFNPIVPGAKPEVLDSIEQLGPERIKKTIIDFGGFVYTSDYVYGKDIEVVHKESFVDNVSQNVRQNELTLYMEDTEKTIKKCQRAGFRLRSVLSMADGPSRDAAQQLAVFERE